MVTHCLSLGLLGLHRGYRTGYATLTNRNFVDEHWQALVLYCVRHVEALGPYVEETCCASNLQGVLDMLLEQERKTCYEQIL